MIVHRRSVNIFFIISFVILVSSIAFPLSRIALEATESIQAQKYNHIAEVSPTIHDWGIIGKPNESLAFIVWANVTDDDNDLANVTVHVSGPNTVIHKLMPFNGTLNVTNMDAFIELGLYDIFVSATDFADNTRTGRHIAVQIQEDTTDIPDPYMTMPIVVVSSLIAACIVCVVAYFYGQRRLKGTT